MSELCLKGVYWWNGEYEGECGLLEGHKGLHYDGMNFFDDDNNPIPEYEVKNAKKIMEEYKRNE